MVDLIANEGQLRVRETGGLATHSLTHSLTSLLGTYLKIPSFFLAF